MIAVKAYRGDGDPVKNYTFVLRYTSEIIGTAGHISVG
jgi:hypothetical protein